MSKAIKKFIAERRAVVAALVQLAHNSEKDIAQLDRLERIERHLQFLHHAERHDRQARMKSADF